MNNFKTTKDAHLNFVSYLEKQNLVSISKPEVAEKLQEFLGPEFLSLKERILDRIFGWGVLEPLAKDKEVTEIMVNGYKSVWVEKNGQLQKTNIEFESPEDATLLATQLAGLAGRRLDETMPLVDARLKDGSRFNAVLPPLSGVGPVITIRRWPQNIFTLDYAHKIGALSLEMAEFLAACVKARQSILIAGSTGAGKTSLLNALAQEIPANQRIITIEDTAEIRIDHPQFVPLEVRQPNIEGRGEVSVRTLVKNGLRMRPDRIIIGEVRGAEALDMLQAMNTGHQGSLATIHANGPQEALERLATNALLADVGLPYEAIVRQIISAIRYVVQVARQPGGGRKVIEIAQVDYKKRDKFTLRPIFKYDHEGGVFLSTKLKPIGLDLFNKAGVAINLEWFSYLN